MDILIARILLGLPRPYVLVAFSASNREHVADALAPHDLDRLHAERRASER